MLDELIRAVGPDHVMRPAPAEYLTDATARGLHGSALAVVRPADATEAARGVAACSLHDIAITPRGGGSGVAGGAVPDGGIVISLERLNRIRSFDPLVWRIQAEAGATTRRPHPAGGEGGLLFSPPPSA